MNKLALLFAVVLTVGWPQTAQAGFTPGVGEGVGGCEPDGIQASGAVYRICMPEAQGVEWNGDLVIYCHGYVEPEGPVDVPEDQFCFGGVCIYEIFTDFGYAFAASSYSVHGLAVPEGIADTLDLIDIFTAIHGEPNRVYLVGFSEGAQIATLIAEMRPDLVTAIVAACGPIGDWRRQIEFIGDFRLLFDVFFPGLIPGDAVDVPEEVADNWDELWEETIRPVLLLPRNRWRVKQLVQYTEAPEHPFSYVITVNETVHDLLWFNIVGAKDAVEKLEGVPFGNQKTFYDGGALPGLVNALVERREADGAALENIASTYETTGRLEVPSVILHTLLDNQVPFWHVPLYQLKVIRKGTPEMATYMPIPAFGHCAFSFGEVAAAFSIAVFRATGELPDFASFFENQADKADFNAAVKQFQFDHLKRVP